jgi:tellurite methyltransferase
VRRSITGFNLDEYGDWVAFLSCGHKQHVRHRPPFEERPWVISKLGRSEKLGEPLDCIRCDRFEMPDNFKVYRKTGEFNERPYLGVCAGITPPSPVCGPRSR